jgi:SpoVK/Ycf46/Vps4 family AAA+-type ATPase
VVEQIANKTLTPIIPNDTNLMKSKISFCLKEIQKKMADLICFNAHYPFSAIEWLYQKLNQIFPALDVNESSIQFDQKTQELLKHCKESIKSKYSLPRILLYGPEQVKQRAVAEQIAKISGIKFHHFEGRKLLQGKNELNKFREVQQGLHMSFKCSRNDFCFSCRGTLSNKNWNHE